MKIHYTSGSFFIEKDGKKIKIANPELLPQYDILQRSSRIIQDGDIFTLPKDLSVEIKDACNSDCCTMDGACGSNCRSPLKVAILSKSSSQEIPDRSNPIDNVDQLRLALNEAIEVLKWHLYKSQPQNDSDQSDFFNMTANAIAQGENAVVGTSTEPYADFIDGSTYVKPNDSKISNSSEKPDFEKIANELLYSFEHRDYFVLGCEKIWNDYVTPRDKTISDLRERVKELENEMDGLTSENISQFVIISYKEIYLIASPNQENSELKERLEDADDLFNCIKQSQDVIPSWMKEAYENYAKGKQCCNNQDVVTKFGIPECQNCGKEF